MKFSKIYITFLFVLLCFPLIIAHFAITGHFPVIGGALLPDNTYIEPLKFSLVNAVICAMLSSLAGSAFAVFFSCIKEKFRVFFSDGANYEVYLFNTIIALILWTVIYVGGKTTGFTALAHSMLCIPIVFLLVRSAAPDAMHTIRCGSEIGSSPVQTFINIIFPDIMPAVISGFIASFFISFNDIIITPVISRNTIQTFPLKLIDYMKNGYNMGSVCILMLICSLLISIIIPTICIKNKK